jgi:flagellar biosynthesis/type III secretory pathway chaperone
MTSTETLKQLLEGKHECLQTLRALGVRQIEQIDAGDMSTLMRILSAKQSLLANLQQIEQDLQPYKAEQPETRVWKSPADRQRSVQLAAECQTLLAEIILQEKEAESRLVVQRNDAEHHLRGMHLAAGAQHAYRQDETLVTNSLDLSTES